MILLKKEEANINFSTLKVNRQNFFSCCWRIIKSSLQFYALKIHFYNLHHKSYCGCTSWREKDINQGWMNILWQQGMFIRRCYCCSFFIARLWNSRKHLDISFRNYSSQKKEHFFWDKFITFFIETERSSPERIKKIFIFNIGKFNAFLYSFNSP
jgi:hypothetical protein